MTSSGRRMLGRRDIRFRSGEREERGLPLGDGFWLVLPSIWGRGPNEVGGFGLTVRNEEIPVFTWEWFVCKEDGKARKLQEEGEIAYTAVATASGCSIIRTEFLTDISLRVLPMPRGEAKLRRMGPPRSPRHHPKWRIRVLAGSVVNWC